MVEDIEKQLLELVTKDHEPGAIIVHPKRLMRFLRDMKPEYAERDPKSSGWKYQGVPIYRSWEIIGPTVVSRDVLNALLKMGRTRVANPSLHTALNGIAAHAGHLDPILF